MSVAGTKRDRLLDWIRNGDPRDVPVLLGPGLEVAASCLGKDEREVTWAEAIRVAEQTGTHNLAQLAVPRPHAAVRFLDDINTECFDVSLPDGTRQSTWIIKTPEGILRQVTEHPVGKPGYYREYLVKGESDLPAFACLIRRTAEDTVRNSAVRCHVDEMIKAKRIEVGDVFPTMIHVFCPAVELMSCVFMDQATALYTIYDQKDLMEDLMDCHWKMTEVWLDIAAENEIDIYNFAVNGFEWLSPGIYEQYMIPQAKRICDFARARGKLSWIHTCGKLKKIAKMKAYQQMGVDVVESLSSPPTGDIDNLAETRSDIGHDMATRGGVNCELFYDNDLDTLRRQAEYVLDSTSGYRHMIGDTNPSYPAYPRRNIQAVIELVRDSGRLFE